MNPTSIILLVGVALAGYSAFLSFTYLTKSKKEGLGALDGWDMLNKFYEHMTCVLLHEALCAIQVARPPSIKCLLAWVVAEECLMLGSVCCLVLWDTA